MQAITIPLIDINRTLHVFCGIFMFFTQYDSSDTRVNSRGVQRLAILRTGRVLVLVLVLVPDLVERLILES